MNPRLRAGYHTWHELITNSTVADAIRDRLIHNAHRHHTERRIYAQNKKPIDLKNRL